MILAMVAGTIAVPIRAQPAPPLQALPSYNHDDWTMKDGAPGGVSGVAQPPDGYLWLGTEIGLFRFDGVTFERLPELEKRGGAGVAEIEVDGSGDTWLRYGDRSLVRVHDGRRTRIRLPDNQSVRTVARTSDGSIWVGGSTTLYHRHAGKWLGYPLPAGTWLRQLVIRDAGDVLAITDDALLYLDTATRQWQRVVTVSMDAALARAPDDGVWLINNGDLRQVRLPRRSATASLASIVHRLGPKFRISHLYFDHTGSLWVVSEGRQLAWLAPPALTATARQNARALIFELSAGQGAFSGGFAEDREGNVWLSSQLGLHRFHPVNIVDRSLALAPLADMTDVSGYRLYQVLQDGRSRIYVRKDNRVFRVDAGEAVPIGTLPAGSMWDGACGSHDGGLWWRTGLSTLRRHDGPSSRSVRLPQAAVPGTSFYSACAEDPEGRLWINGPSGFHRVTDAGPRRFEVESTQPGAGAFTFGPDGMGGMITYHGYGETRRIVGDRIATILPNKSNPLSFVEVIRGNGRYVLIGGERGLVQFDGGAVRTISSDQYPFLQDVSGIVQTRAGDTWLLGKTGLTRLRTRELEARFRDPRAPLRWRTFGDDDGLHGMSEAFGYANLFQGDDGMLWMATNNGIYSLDPSRIQHNRVVPPVSITRMTVDGAGLPLAADQRLKAGAQNLQIDFTALSLSVPKRVRFRYRLLGSALDGWIDPGERRQAIFTNLGPGTYRFQVIAANDEGVWNRTGATLRFTIPPTFVQSWYFTALCALAALLAIWGAYSLRLRQISGRIRMRVEERDRERQRIARELHDTILQRFQGLMLHFQAALDTLPPKSGTGEKLGRALDLAEEAIVEGRRRVHMLRENAEPVALANKIEEIAGSMLASSPLQWSVSVEGPTILIQPWAADDIAQVIGEAIANTLRHAAAERVEIALVFGRSQLTVSVADDGVGLPQQVLDGDEVTGHYGLVGMRERAKQQSGAIQFVERPGGGTNIILRLPLRTIGAGR
ncbi:ATP-binding protein [Sphingomonas sp. MMS12-HWE2-04]|uniref:sensor histidine kinase n=1 Tax=Sphingomonas sp. MMS12-HWE2-04 TaxID=3234199 RepID=UPI003850A35D